MLDELIKALKKDEGFRATAYQCSADKWTAGYGRNLESKGLTKLEVICLLSGDGCLTKEKAEAWLRADIAEVTVECAELGIWYHSLNDSRKLVILNMVFNLGMRRFLGFKRMIVCLKDCDFTGASREMLNSRWAVQVGRRATRLAQEMKEGVYLG